MKIAALVIVNPVFGQLGHARRLDDALGGTTVLGMTLRRVSAIAGLDRVLLVQPEGEARPCDAGDIDPHVPVEVVSVDSDAWSEAATKARRIRRAWTLDGWRGGFRGATVWDELLPAAPLADACKQHGLDAALLVGGDWPLVDPALCGELVSVHRSTPETTKLCFSQAPPGLSGVLVAATLLKNMAETGHDFASLLAYNPRRPALDPISLEFNVAIPASVRDMARRMIYDTAAGQCRIRRSIDRLGSRALAADALEITDAVERDETPSPAACFETLPPQIVIELTTQRLANGPMARGHHAEISRADLPLELFDELAPQLNGRSVTLGGTGDARLYGELSSAIEKLKAAGALAVAMETDLLAKQDESAQDVVQVVLDAGPDVLMVRLHAETAATYRQEMGVDGFSQVMQTMQGLFQTPRAQRPALVPILAKTETTTPELETFFERWWQLADHVVVQRFSTGGKGRFALAPDRNPVPMDPPWRQPSPLQRKHRLTVWSDGDVSLCHQDWQGRATLGNIKESSLLDIWQRVPEMRMDSAWSPDDSPMCRRCFDFASIHALEKEAAVC